MHMCPCGSSKPYNQCCYPFLHENQIPATPEALMRSRYTAYSEANIDYIVQTMKGPALENFDAAEARAWAREVNWIKLNVLKSPTPANNKGFVEFAAHYLQHNQECILHEFSEFHLENGKWYYIQGVEPKLSRNESCFCGSNKKFKKCCGR